MPPKIKQMTRQSTFLARGPKRKLQRETCIHRQGNVWQRKETENWYYCWRWKNNGRQWMHAVLTLCLDLNKSLVSPTSLKIKCCNSSLLNDTSFSKTFCDTEPCDECHVFGDVFQPGIKIRNYEESKSTPKDPHLLCVFQKLLNFNKWQNSRQIKQVKRLRRSQRKISSSVPDVHVRNKLSSFIAGGFRYH